MIANILMTILWFVVWLLLSWPPEPRYVMIGIPVAILVTFMTAGFFEKKGHPFRSPLACLWFVYYAAVFVWECLKANIDVAYRVLHPDIPIRPGTIKVKTALKSDIGLTFLANSITLTPGTTTVDVDKEKGLIYVHMLYIRKGLDPSAMRLPVVEKFERIIKRIFE